VKHERREDIFILLTNFAGTIISDQNNTPPPPEGELKFQIQIMMKMIERMNFVMANVSDKLEKEEKQRLRVSNIYHHNAFMMLDKKREAERLAKVYKETNKEREEWRSLVQRQKDKKMKNGSSYYHSKILIRTGQ
jgi:hypothetical protein